MPDPTPLLAVEALVKEFGGGGRVASLRGRPSAPYRAVDQVSLQLQKGETLGIVGGSGSGKTTLARCLIRLIEADAGAIRVDGEDIRQHRGAELRELRRRMQMIFQDPYTSLNPRMSIGSALYEAGRVHRRPGSENEAAFVGRLLDLVQLSPRFAARKPNELSGGQRQRAAIARALAVGPELLIADEAVSALDVSVQAQLLNLFLDLRDELGLAILFITHQLAVVAEVANRLMVMHRGKVVERGVTGEIFANPQDDYTKTLLAAHPHHDPGHRDRIQSR